MSKKNRFVIIVALTALVGVLFGSFVLPAPSLSKMKEAVEDSGDYVYEKMGDVYDHLQEFLQTGNAERFELAKSELAKAIAVCESYGAYYGYRSPDDRVDDVGHGWCVAFMKWASDCLSEMDPTRLTATERADVESVALVFAPLLDKHNFAGMMAQFGQSPLVHDERFQKPGKYDWNGVLIMPTN